MRTTVDKIKDILLYADTKFAFTVLGLACVVWGSFGLVYTPDLQWFAKGFTFEVSPWLWGFNHIVFGAALLHCAVEDFPPGRSLLIGSYGCMAWTWIFMSAVLIQRSGPKR